MTKHLIPIIIKFIMITLVLEIVLLLFSDMSFGAILGLSLILTIIAYILGDMIILPATNNAVATIADIGLTLVLIYLYDYLWVIDDKVPFFSAILAGAMIGGSEWFFHKIVDRSASEESDIW